MKQTHSKIVQTDASENTWGAILLQELDIKRTICRYSGGIFEIKIVNALNAEIQAIIEAINKFRIFLDKKVIIETNSENKIKHVNKNICKTFPTKLYHRRL